MQIFGLSIPQIPVSVLPFVILILSVVLVILIIFVLRKKRNYSKKTIDMKHAPLDISNLLKDGVKRQILRTLKTEKKYVSAIAKEIYENAPRTTYHLKQLEKRGLVKSFKLARENYFFLTKKGLWCIDVIDYYYPKTNIQFLINKFKKLLGKFKIKRFVFKETPKINNSIKDSS